VLAVGSTKPTVLGSFYHRNTTVLKNRENKEIKRVKKQAFTVNK
jgi:hypothetical protein